MPTLLLDRRPVAGRSVADEAEPIRIAIAHNKGGVSKTTSTFVLGKNLARSLRVELVDLDRTRYLTEVVMQLSPHADGRLASRLWLRTAEAQPSDVVLIDSEPAREHYAREALVRADYVLIPVPPEPMCLKGLVLMLEVIDQVRTDHRDGNPFLQVLGVLPTMFDRRWPDHAAWLGEMAQLCTQRGIRLFPPIPRRQSYTRLSTAGQDYRPVADVIEALVQQGRTTHGA